MGMWWALTTSMNHPKISHKSHNKLQMNEKESALRIEIQRKRLNFE